MVEDNFVAKTDYKEGLKKALNFLKINKIQWIITIALFLIILFASTSIRISNLDALKDITTGNYSLADLDAQYFYRIAQTTVDNNGVLPATDNMRYLGAVPLSGWLKELLPKFIILVYKLTSIFNSDFSVLDAAVYAPVILYFIGLIIFFLLAYVITKSKLASIISTALLAYSPIYLHRSVAGFVDHDIMGMGAMFLCFLIYALSLKNFEKNWKNSVIWGILTGTAMALLLCGWGGGVNFVMIAIPFAFFFYYLLNSKDKLKNIVFYSLILISGVIFTAIFGLDMSDMYRRFFLSYGLAIPFVFGFMIIDYVIEKLPKIKESKYFKAKYEKLYSLIITIILGLIALPLLGKNIFEIVQEMWLKLFHPFGLGRIGLTVAENAQPYLTDWISQTGKPLFYLFVFGAILVGFDFARHTKSKKSKIFLGISWMYMISAILFSRISSESLFNGESLLSQLFYLSGLLLFAGVFFWEYVKERFNADSNIILFIALIFVSLINGRSALRVFLMITPFVFLCVGYLASRIIEYYKNSKEELLKGILIVALVISLVIAGFSFYQYYQGTTQQAQYIGAATNYQWQNAMAWVRENTDERDVFVHWWDYGYFVQTIGERPTVTDGGHYVGYWDHLIGRYLLTTPYPETAMSYMKTNNVSYLLIDPTDIGKYPAYSSIGSDDNQDRYSGIIAMVSDQKQIQETAEGEIRVYQGGYGVEEDMVYNDNGTEIFLPGPTYNLMNRPEFKSYIIGTIIETKKLGTNISASVVTQPQGVFLYNNKQYKIPLRYVEVGGRIYDYKEGIEAGVKIIPNIVQSTKGLQVDSAGALIYLSPRVFNGLVGQLYILNDASGKYPDIKIAHTEDSQVVEILRNQGMQGLGEFVYYQGIQGPLKIWKVEYDKDVVVNEEFLSMDGDWAEFDNLTFVK